MFFSSSWLISKLSCKNKFTDNKSQYITRFKIFSMECKVSIFCCCFKPKRFFYSPISVALEKLVSWWEEHREYEFTAVKEIDDLFGYSTSQENTAWAELLWGIIQESRFINHSFWFQSFVFIWLYKPIIEKKIVILHYFMIKSNNLGLIFI